MWLKVIDNICKTPYFLYVYFYTCMFRTLSDVAQAKLLSKGKNSPIIICQALLLLFFKPTWFSDILTSTCQIKQTLCPPKKHFSLTFPILLKKPLHCQKTQNVVLTAAQLITCNFHSLESEYLLSLYITYRCFSDSGPHYFLSWLANWQY